MAKHLLAGIARPTLLARAAAAGAALYRRDRDLRAVSREIAKARGWDLVERLYRLEARCDDDRRAGRPAYSVTRHVQVLSALAAEAAQLAQIEAAARPRAA